MTAILHTFWRILAMISFLSCRFIHVSSTKALNHGVNHVLTGTDVSMSWTAYVPISNITVQTIKNNIDSTLVIQQDTKSQEYYTEISLFANVTRKLKVVPGSKNFSLILTNVNMNNSQTFKFNDKEYIIDVYEPPRIITSTIENQSFNLTVFSNPSPNITWFLNDRLLDNISLRRNGSLYHYTGTYPQSYICNTFIKLDASLYGYQLTRTFPLPNDYRTFNESLHFNNTDNCFTLEWVTTVSNCDHTGYEIFFSPEKVDLLTVNFSLINTTKLPANQRSSKRCFDHSKDVVYVYFRTLYGTVATEKFKEITNNKFKCSRDEAKKTQYPPSIHVLAGVGSVVTIMLFVCCLSHCILLQKKREAMKGVVLKVNGETENETAIFLPTDDKSTPSPVNGQNDVVIINEEPAESKNEKHEENRNNDLKITINDTDDLFSSDGALNNDTKINITYAPNSDKAADKNVNDCTTNSSSDASSPISTGDEALLIPVSPCDEDQVDGKDGKEINEVGSTPSMTSGMSEMVDVKEDKPLIETKENPTKNDVQEIQDEND